MKETRLLDKWSIVHVGLSALMGATDMPRPWAYAFIVGTELIEARIGLIEAPRNVVSDLALGAATFELVRRRGENR